MKNLCTLFILMVGNIFLSQAQERYTMTITDKVQPSMNNVVKLAPEKSLRLRSSYGGKFKIIFDSNRITPVMQSAIRNAVELWEEQLLVKKEIPLVFTDTVTSNNNIATVTKVSYVKGNDGVTYPELAAINMGVIDEDFIGGITSKIYINSNPDLWDYYIDGQTDPEKVSLETAVLRSVAHILGFGSSIRCKNPDRRQMEVGALGVYSNFDRYILDGNNNNLVDIPSNSNSQLYAFYTCNNAYLQFSPNNDTYVLRKKLYAPVTLDNNYSLRTFDTEEDLMSKNFRKKGKITEIDEITQQSLRLVGWDFTITDLNINGVGISNNGIGSAYSAYTFNATSSSQISNQHWKYELLNNYGEFITVKEIYNTNNFAIDPVSNLNLYKKNTKGDITGRIILKAVVNGKEIEKIFNLNLECKVSAINVRQVKIEKDNISSLFELTLEVEYFGGDYLTMMIEQENIMTLTNRTVNEKNYAVFKCKNLRMGRYIWFDFTTRNQYGVTAYTYELAPVRSTSDMTPNIVTSLEKTTVPAETNYKVYNIYGSLIGNFDSDPATYNNGISRGIYLVNETDKNGNIVHSKKIIIK